MPAWTPVLETSRKFSFRYFKKYLITRRQFPLCSSAGRTIHKVQGATMNAAVLHFGKRKIDHIHYVGLSRVTRLSNVHITELNADKISVSLEVQAEMQRLRSERCIPQTPCLLSFGPDVDKVCFHNCRSLTKHLEGMKYDNNLMSADILGLVETRVYDHLNEALLIEGFKVFVGKRVDVPHGLVIYYKATLPVDFLCCKSTSSIEYCLLTIRHEILVCFVYCPPKAATIENYTRFLCALADDASDHLSSNNLVLIGDFNYDYLVKGSFSMPFKKYKLQQLVDTVTTDYGTCLDHIYTNLSDACIVSSGTMESYYSDHKPLYFVYSQR